MHCIVSSKIILHHWHIYDKRDYFVFEIVNFPFLDGNVPRSLPIVFIFRFARACSNFSGFKRNQI